MSKAKEKKKASKKKTADLYHILRDLNPGERILEVPQVFGGEFRFARQAACRSQKRYGILREGVLYMFSTQKTAEMNLVWRSLELSKCVISYRDRDQKIILQIPERYRLRVLKPVFQQWVDNLRAHRLYSLYKMATGHENAKAEIETKPVRAATSGITVVEVPVQQLTPDAKTQEQSKSRVSEDDTVTKSGAAVAIVQNVEKKAPSTPKQPDVQPVVVRKKEIAIPTSERVENNLKMEAKPTVIAVRERSRKEPMTMTVEVIMKDQLEPSPVSKTPIAISTGPTTSLATESHGISSKPMVVLKDVVVPSPPVPVAVVTAQGSEIPQPTSKKPVTTTKQPVTITNQVTLHDSDKSNSGDGSGIDEEKPDGANSIVPSKSVKPFRTTLPAPMHPPPSLFRLIMSAIGRDIMRMTLPASVLEPLSTLQVLCEELEYADLIERAVAHPEPQWRMMFIAALAVARYGTTANRVGRKPFNPLLGETYEFVHPTQGWRFLAEQVSHHPAISAAYAEGKGWRFWQDLELSASLSATAVKATPIGLTNVLLERHGETYTWNKVLSQVTGILTGKYTIDHLGEMVVSCPKNKLKCRLTFKKMAGQHRGDVEGQLVDEKGNLLKNVFGNWREKFFVGTPDNHPVCIWRLAPMPRDYQKYYGLPQFSLGLNEMRPDVHGVLPKSDSRFRPDQKLLENGKVDEAEKLKRELEENQRKRKKVNETAKTSHQPQWFRATGNTDGAAGSRWQFTGKYWEAKEEQFKDVEFLELW